MEREREERQTLLADDEEEEDEEEKLELLFTCDEFLPSFLVYRMAIPFVFFE